MLISPLPGGGGTITDILNYYHLWKATTIPDILRTSIYDWVRRSESDTSGNRSIESIFHRIAEYQAADSPYEGEAHIIQIPDDSGARRRIILIPYMTAISCIYIGFYWHTETKIYWQKIDLNFTNINF